MNLAEAPTTKIKTEEETALLIANRLLQVTDEGNSLYISIKREELHRLCMGMIKSQGITADKNFLAIL